METASCKPFKPSFMEEEKEQPLPEIKRENKTFKKFPIIVVAVIVVLLILWRVGVLPFGKKAAEEEVKPPEVQQTITPPPATTTPEVVQPQPQTPAPPKAEELNKKAIGIRVLNGSGVTGAAAKVRTFLEEKGWKVLSVGNADRSDYAQSELSLKEKAKKYQNALKSDLSSYTIILGDPVEATATADVEFIVGLK